MAKTLKTLRTHVKAEAAVQHHALDTSRFALTGETRFPTPTLTAEDIASLKHSRAIRAERRDADHRAAMIHDAIHGNFSEIDLGSSLGKKHSRSNMYFRFEKDTNVPFGLRKGEWMVFCRTRPLKSASEVIR